MRGQLGRLPPLSEAAATVRSRGPTGRASIRAADDVLETGLQSDEILACFEEALGERQPEMGTDAAAGREANAERSEKRKRRARRRPIDGHIDSRRRDDGCHPPRRPGQAGMMAAVGREPRISCASYVLALVGEQRDLRSADRGREFRSG